MTTSSRLRALAPSLSQPLVALHLAWLAAWSMSALHPAACTAPWWPRPTLHAAAPGIGLLLVGLWLARAAFRGPLVLRGGLPVQTLVGALLAAGLAGALMSAGCGWLEAHLAPADTYEHFTRAFGISLWQVRGEALQWAGLPGVLLLHLCARRHAAGTPA